MDYLENSQCSHKRKSNGKKSPLRFVFAALAIYAVCRILPGVGINLLYLRLRSEVNFSNSEAASVGVIGGADGPTSVFVAAPVWTAYLMYIALLVVGIFGFYYFGGFQKRK